jgi:gamma-butyrobetaine dioxygenase/trimethyllysine dioxygenase
MNDVQRFDRWLRVPLAAGHADFHYKWLRHACDQDRHPSTRERMVDSSDIPDDVSARAAWLADDALHVEWAHDGRVSRYALAWLDAHAYARDRVAVPPPPSSLEAITLLHTANRPLATTVAAALELLDARGVVVVRRSAAITTPPQDETEAIIEAFAVAGLRVIPTHFGRIEDLRTDNTTNANTDQLGYTNAPVDPHTDQPFIPHPPRLQLLQGIRAAERGGESSVVDARAAAEYLRDQDPEAYALLSTIPVHFHRKQAAFESLVVAPILSGEGSGFMVRYSYFTMDPQRLPFARMSAWYRAYDAFARIVRNPAHQVRFVLAPGDFLLYDNHRMLHARSGFAGARWLRGIYFDR